MNKILIYLVVFLFSFSLALAVSVVTDKTEYSGKEQVIITTNQCSGISVVKIINPNNLLVDIKGGADNGVFNYNTLSDSADGKYKINATCTNGAAETFFCVDAPGCLGVVTPTVANVTGAAAPAGTPGGAGAGCVSQWDCYSWSYCDVYLKQSRTCVDINKCQPAKKEMRDCDKCEESWVCSLWSECTNGRNYRNCNDEHACETMVLKPGLQKLCTEEEAPGPAPVQVSPSLPPPYYAPPVEQKESFWKENLFYLIMIPLVIIAILIVILLTFHFLKPKRLAYNLNELKQWVRKERAMGTSDVDIRAILKEHTGWRDEEIAQALERPQESSGNGER